MEYSEIPSDKREFRCSHCNGKILIPKNLPPTTGPCPRCGVVITSPALETQVPPAYRAPDLLLTPAIPAIPEKQTPPPAPVDHSQAVEAPALPSAKKETGKPRVELPTPKNPPEAKKPKENHADTKPEGPKKSGLIPVMLVLLVVFACAGVAVYFVFKEKNDNVSSPAVTRTGADPATKEANYIRIGWRKEAYQVLRDYMAATTSKGKLPYVLNSEALASRIDDFYGGGVINDSDTPADAFSIYDLSEDDRRRGLFMMVYDQPPQFDMKEFFRPLASLEVQYGIDEADLLLSTMARVGNFAMEPLRVHAFFKRTPEGLRLDWEMFAQTKYRTFQSFVELPESGQSGTFRVFIVEDVPDKSHLEAGTRTYRIADPANTGDTARVNVKVDSEIGRTLSIINWRGGKDNHPNVRTATIELKWVGENSAPELAVSRFICWEFLGLGGKEPTSTASTQ